MALALPATGCGLGRASPSLNLSFSICKMGELNMLTLQDCCGDQWENRYSQRVLQMGTVAIGWRSQRRRPPSPFANSHPPPPRLVLS